MKPKLVLIRHPRVSASFSPMRLTSAILRVEDSEDDAFLLQVALKEVGIEHSVVAVRIVAEAKNYFWGLRLTDRKAHPLPGIVFLDVHLPGYSGLELLVWLRTHEQFRTTVVIMITASITDNDVTRASRLGANSYLPKPSTPRLESNIYPHVELSVESRGRALRCFFRFENVVHLSLCRLECFVDPLLLGIKPTSSALEDCERFIEDA